MKYSQLFTKTLRTPPANAETINHKLLVQGGFVRQLMAGVYTYSPLGLRVLNNISKIVREEMDTIGSQEVLMPMLHPAAIWKQTGGWDNIDVLFKLKSRTGKEHALSQSHEEVVTPLAKEWIHNVKDLPLSIYHIQWKFRDELRSKAGILRGREFLMKDMYSWQANQEEFDKYYAVVKEAYLKVFKRLGLTAKVTEASGGAFTEKISYEFEVLTDAGEANILYCKSCDYCVNVDDITTYKIGDKCPKCGNSELAAATAAELGNIFDLGQKYSKAFDVTFIDNDGTKKYPIMGSYGIGISRTMGVLVETFHDERGIIWPKNVAPFAVQLIAIAGKSTEVIPRAEKIYEQLTKIGVEVLFDDRVDAGAGQKFADADLIGNPIRMVVSEKTGEQVEIKLRNEAEATLMSLDEALKNFVTT
ncbi:MAG: aminoacyl--tRNA ligase-related protein [bacterium]